MPERSDTRGIGQAKEAEAVRPAETSALARHGDPSVRRRRTDGRYASSEPAEHRGVQWVRASDLLTRSGIRIGDTSVKGQQVMVKSIRTGMGRLNPVSKRGISRRSSSRTAAAPVSAFGQQPRSGSITPGTGIAS
jgi:hypothetical protein